MRLRNADMLAGDKYARRHENNGWDKPTSLYAGFVAGILHERARIRKEERNAKPPR